MANGAPSPDGFTPKPQPETVAIAAQALPEEGAPESLIEEHFHTYQAHYQAIEEVRDPDTDQIVRAAEVQITHTVMLQMGPIGLILKQYKTRYSPQFAEQCAEGLAEAAAEALDSMKEKPLDTSALQAKGIDIATNMSDVERAAEAARAADQQLRGQ